MRPLGGAKVGTSCQKSALLIDFFDFKLYVISVWNELGSYSFQALSTATQSTMSFLEYADMSQNYTAIGRRTLKKIQIYKLLIYFIDFQLYVISDWYELGSCNFQALSTAAKSIRISIQYADMSQN